MNGHHSPQECQPWLEIPNALTPAEDEVHVWRVDLDVPSEVERQLWTLLDGEERGRANRFHFSRHRSRFLVARGALRAILAGYLGTGPAQVRFQYNPHGKPFLVEELAPSGLAFNLAHSNSMALVAATWRRNIGVDLEQLRPDFATEEIAARFFSAREVRALQALPAEARTQAFFNCWTRKEAFIKAKGLGLSLALDSFEVTLAPGTPARLLSTRDDPAEAARWSLEALYPHADYAAAVVVEGHGWRLRLCRWPGVR